MRSHSASQNSQIGLKVQPVVVGQKMDFGTIFLIITTLAEYFSVVRAPNSGITCSNEETYIGLCPSHITLNWLSVLNGLCVAVKSKSGC